MSFAQQKPLFLLLLGVEGSGHHMLMSFLRHFFESKKVVQHGDWHPFQFNYWDALASIKKKATVDRSDMVVFRNEIREVMKKYDSTKVLYSGVSFPYGVERDSLRRPDIVDMVEMLSEFVEFRPLIIFRDPISCTYSAVRRGFNTNVLHQARIVEDNLIYIKQQIQACQLQYKTIGFEKFVDRPNTYENSFKSWWNIDNESYQQGLKEIKSSTAKKDIPKDLLLILEQFFSETRCRQWDQFLSSQHLKV